jgi:hypothetical protein
MKLQKLIVIVAGTASAMLFGLSVEAQSCYNWVISDTYKYLPQQWSMAKGVCSDPAGNVYVAGEVSSNYVVLSGKLRGTNQVFRGLIRKWDITNNSWSNVDDYAYPSPGKDAEYNRIACSPNGNLYAVGQFAASTGGFHWIVRESTDGGSSWQTVDDYTGPAGRSAQAAALVIAPNGDIYVTGTGVSLSGKSTVDDWITRRSQDGGAHWVKVDDVTVSGYHLNGVALASTGTNLVATALGAGSQGLWLIRQSATGDLNSWSPAFSIASGQPYTSGVDANGNIYVAGFSWVTNSGCNYNRYWTVLRSSQGGNPGTWQLVDFMANQANWNCGSGPMAQGFALDGLNQPVLVGFDYNINSSPDYCLVRCSPTGDSQTWIGQDFLLSTPYGGRLLDVARDPFGNLYAVGVEFSTAGQLWLVLRASP